MNIYRAAHMAIKTGGAMCLTTPGAFKVVYLLPTEMATLDSDAQHVAINRANLTAIELISRQWCVVKEIDGELSEVSVSLTLKDDVIPWIRDRANWIFERLSGWVRWC